MDRLTGNPRELTGMLTSRDRAHLDALWKRYHDAANVEALSLQECQDLATLIEQHVARAVTVYFTNELEALHKSRRGS